MSWTTEKRELSSENNLGFENKSTDRSYMQIRKIMVLKLILESPLR